MRSYLTIPLFLLGLAALAVYSAFFIVHQNEQALVVEFGKPKRVISEPGLNYLIPFVQTVEIFDKRILDLDTQPQEVIVADQKRLVVDAFARYRIVDPLRFYQSVRDERMASSRLRSFLDASLRRVLGSATFQQVVRDNREGLMASITKQLSEEARKLGVEVVDVRIKRADVPQENRISIYDRMRTERQREAAEFRAKGEEKARGIRADADKQVVVTKAEAMREAERIRGDGDAQRNVIFAQAFNQDPDFFAFYRSMQSYELSLTSGDTRIILSPESEYFRYFNDSMGKPKP